MNTKHNTVERVGADQNLREAQTLNTGGKSRQDSTPSHTPGPWRVEKIGGNYMGPGEKGKAFRILAPSTHDQKQYEVGLTYYKPHIEEAEANARLIAVAPELLEACKAALQCQIDGLDENTVDSLEAAIAAAEGRAS